MKCKQLFCSIPTSLVPAQMLDNPFDPAAVPVEDRYNNGFSLISLLHEESMDSSDSFIFRNNCRSSQVDLFYLCSYIPVTFNKEPSSYIDYRSQFFVLGFKQNSPKEVDYVAKILCHELVGHCALVAVPPSKVQKNGKTAVHTLIKRIMASVDPQKEITDASSCLVCCNDSAEFHKSLHLRSPEQVYQNIEVVNPELIQGKDVLLIDDILTSGSHFEACKRHLMKYARSVTLFVVGRTLHVEHFNAGVVLHLDNLFTKILNGSGSSSSPTLFRLFHEMNDGGFDFRIISSLDEKACKSLCELFSLSSDRIISCKPSLDGISYGILAAKQIMEIYDPFLISATDSSVGVRASKRFPFIVAFLGLSKTEGASLANYNFTSIWGFLFSFWDIVLDKLSLCQYFSRSAYYKEIDDPLWMEKACSMEENIFKSEFYQSLFASLPGITPEILAKYSPGIKKVRFEYQGFMLLVSLYKAIHRKRPFESEADFHSFCEKKYFEQFPIPF